MREIKFRVWDNVDYMSSPFTLRDLQQGKIKFTDECNVMQFTGLHDKNGKEIYEGDILKKTGDKDGYTFGGLDIGCVSECELTKFRYWLKHESFGYEGEDLEDWEEWEVIGNIHEHDQLLNEK